MSLNSAGRRLFPEREKAMAGTGRANVRDAVRQSWQRATGHGINPDRDLPPVVLERSTVLDRRRAHPLAAVWPILRHAAGPALTEASTMLFVADAQGHVLWSAGPPASVRDAERIHLVEGAQWTEATAGTTGLGTAMALNSAFQVYGAEHYLSAVTNYVCSAIPVWDPVTGDPIGVIDLTTGLEDSRPAAMSLVMMAARLAESALAEDAMRRHADLRQRYAGRLARITNTNCALVTAQGHVLQVNPKGWLPRRIETAISEGSHVLPDGRVVTIEAVAPGGPFLVIEQVGEKRCASRVIFSGLGLSRGWLRIDDSTYRLSVRHSELVAILIAHPSGLSALELAAELYGPTGKSVTVRAELARLRQLLGNRLESDPYRLVGQVRADFLEATGGEVASTLLPGSTAPGITKLRAGRG